MYAVRRGELLSYLRRKTWFRMSNGATNSHTTDSINPKIGHAIRRQRQRRWEKRYTHTEINRPFRREKFDQAERRKTRNRSVLTQCSLFSLTAAEFSDYYWRRKASRERKKLFAPFDWRLMQFTLRLITSVRHTSHHLNGNWHAGIFFFNREKEMDSGPFGKQQRTDWKSNSIISGDPCDRHRHIQRYAKRNRNR